MPRVALGGSGRIITWEEFCKLQRAANAAAQQLRRPAVSIQPIVSGNGGDVFAFDEPDNTRRSSSAAPVDAQENNQAHRHPRRLRVDGSAPMPSSSSSVASKPNAAGGPAVSLAPPSLPPPLLPRHHDSPPLPCILASVQIPAAATSSVSASSSASAAPPPQMPQLFDTIICRICDTSFQRAHTAVKSRLCHACRLAHAAVLARERYAKKRGYKLMSQGGE